MIAIWLTAALNSASRSPAASVTSVRIGEVTRRTRLTARMIRYYENRGQQPNREPGARKQPHVAEDDIRRLRVLRALLAAGVPADDAVDAVHGRLDSAQLQRVKTTA